MSTNQIALSSLALDLRRVAMGYNRGSATMADRFLEEALLRKAEIDTTSIQPYLVKLLEKLDDLKKEPNHSNKAEDALLYSILFQNAAISLS